MTIYPYHIIAHFGPKYIIERLWLWIIKLHNMPSVGFHLLVIEQVLSPVTGAVENVLLVH
jgi:hypothetical protein